MKLISDSRLIRNNLTLFRGQLFDLAGRRLLIDKTSFADGTARVNQIECTQHLACETVKLHSHSEHFSFIPKIPSFSVLHQQQLFITPRKLTILMLVHSIRSTQRSELSLISLCHTAQVPE